MSRLVCLLLMLACESKPGPPGPPGPPLTAAESQPAATVGAPVPVAEPKPERSHGLSFRLASASAAADSSELPGLGQLIGTEGAEVTLDLDDGSRVVLAPQTRVCALSWAPSLLLLAGQVSVTRLPDAARAGTTAARIATLAGALEASSGTDALLRSAAQAKPGKRLWEARVQLQLLRGAATWLSLDPRAQLRETQLSSGGSPTPIAGLHWLAAAQPGFDAAFGKVRWHALAPAEDSDRALDTALSEQQGLRDRGHELLASVSPHHAALAKLARDGSRAKEDAVPTASTREYQRALVEHAQRSHAHAAQLLLAAERSALQALLACGDNVSGSCATLQAWSARFASRVAGLL